MNHFSAFGVVVACLFALSGCGGGGGGGGSAPIPTYTIGGTVSGLIGSGLTLHNGSENLPIGANGRFTFVTAVASGAAYNVTISTQPSSPTQTCTVTNGSGTASANVTNVQVNCIRTVGGTVTGLKGSGLVLANNNSVLLSIGDNGSFNFPAAVASGAAYNVTISTQPSSPTQTCTVTNGIGTVPGTNNDNVTNISIDCGTWTRQLGSTPASTPAVVNDDFGLATATDASGNIYVTGYTQGDLPGTFNPDTTRTFAAAYVVKYDKYGKKLWTREFGNNPTTEHLLGLAIATDGFGHVYVTGSTRGNFDGHTLSGASDLFVVQFNQDTGVRGWSAQLGAAATETHTYGIATDGSGNVYVAGSTSGGLDGQPTLGGYDLFVVKYNSSGAKQWTRQFGSSLNDKNDGGNLESNGNIIATDSSGNVYVTGYTFGSMPASPDGYANPANPGTPTKTDAVVAKISTNGALQWTRQFGTSEHDKGNGIALDASGHVYVAGMTAGNLADGTSLGGALNVFVVKYGSDGGGISGTRTGLVQRDGVGYGVVTDASGVYVAGTVFNTTSTRFDLLMLKFDQTTLSWQWTQTLGADAPSLDTKGFGIAFDSVANAIYATGFTEGGLDGNINAGTSYMPAPLRSKDIFLVKYNQSGDLQ